MITTVVRDITDRKRAEDSIRILNADLERRVTIRTAELVRSTEAMRQFAWAASHDLQEPLRMVLAYTQMLERRLGEHPGDDVALFLRYISTGARRLDTLLAGLRRFIQTTEASEQELTPVDCNAAVDQAIRTCNRR